MAAIGGYVLIVFGSIILIQAISLKFAFPSIMRLGMPMGLRMMPLNQNFRGWVEIPVPMAVVVRITGISYLASTDGSVGGGEMHLEIDLGKWVDDDEAPLNLTEVVFIQETSEIDQIQHYKVALGKYMWSAWNIFAVFLILLGICGVGVGIVWKIRASPKEITKE